MKAQVITAFGNPSVFTLSELPIPTLKPGHALLRVFATSVNQIDCKIRSGLVPAISPAFPAVLHGDVAGVVAAIADDVKNINVGDEVYGCAGGLKDTGGALAEFMLVDATLISKKPKSLSMIEAAALPLVGITAWEALFTKITLTQKNTILIHGGVGGVGHIAVQLAKYAGATIFTTVLKNEDRVLATTLGANDVINAKQEDVEQYVARLTKHRGFDVVFDTVGGANLDKSFIAAGNNGSVVTIAARSTHDLTPLHSKALSLHVVFMLLPLLKNEGRETHGKILSQLADIVDAGKLKPMLDPKTFTLATAADAHAYLESGKSRGKVVISLM